MPTEQRLSPGVATEKLRGAWCDVLGLDELADDDNFFELGGHSMLATRLISRAERILDVTVPPRLLFEHPVFSDFAKQAVALLDEVGTRAEPPPRLGLSSGPLSYQQEQQMVVEHLLGPSAMNNALAVVRVSRQLPTATVRQALTAVLARHPALRTAIVGEPGEQRQLLLAGDAVPPVPIDEIDLVAISTHRLPSEIRRRIAKAHRQPFDLASGQLLRCQILRCGDRPDVLALHFHHSACDGAGIGVLLDDLASTCADPEHVLAVDDAELSYLDYAHWQHANTDQLLADSRPHWRAILRTLSAEPRDDEPSAALGRPYAHCGELVGADTVRTLRAWAAKDAVTDFAVLAAAGGVAVAAGTGRSAVGLGTLLDNRSLPGSERTVGTFSVSSLLMLEVSGAATARELARQLQRRLAEARRWAALPLELQLAEPAEEMGINPAEVLDLVVSLDRIYLSDATSEPIFSMMEDDGPLPKLPAFGPRLSIQAVIRPSDELDLVIEYLDGEPDGELARQLLVRTVAVLRAFAERPDEPLAELARGWSAG
jgi:hypothetical protein